MNRIQNSLFAALVVVFLSGPLVLIASGAIGLTLPAWLTAEEARYLSGGYTEVDLSESLNLAGFTEGKLQKDISTAIENDIPMKYQVLLGNSALQRRIIACSSIPFSWECYPTYYGSDYVWLPSTQSVMRTAVKKGDTLKLLKEFSEQLREVAQRHPDRRFVLVVPQRNAHVDVNPTMKLVRDPLTIADAVKVLTKSLKGCDNIVLTHKTYDSLESYYADYFKTDHHWNISGTINNYNMIADALHFEPFSAVGIHDAEEGYRFCGALARSGLLYLDESAQDVAYDFSHLTIKNSSGDEYPYTRDGFFGMSDMERKYKFYDNYLDLGNNITINNSQGEGKALIVGDSFEGSLERILASHYSQLDVSRELHATENVSGRTRESRFEDLLNREDYDEVYIVAGVDNLAAAIRTTPDYFEDTDGE